AKLREIGAEREHLTAQLKATIDTLKDAVEFIETNLRLLEDPYELYMNASDEVRPASTRPSSSTSSSTTTRSSTMTSKIRSETSSPSRRSTTPAPSAHRLAACTTSPRPPGPSTTRPRRRR